MKIYIDHFSSEKEFAIELTNRLRNIHSGIEVTNYEESKSRGKNPGKEADRIVSKLIDESDVIIPIVTPDFLIVNSPAINAKFEIASENKNKYLIPFIYKKSNWSSIKWIVRSRVFPDNGQEYFNLNDEEQKSIIAGLVQHVANIFLSTLLEPSISTETKKVQKSSKTVFISHAHKDGDFAELLKLKLEANKIDAWLDTERLKIGQDWREEIDDGITNSLAVLAIMTPDARKSEYVTYEWAFAWGKGIKIFPLMLEQTPIHPRLESLQYLDFTNRVTRPWEELYESIRALK